MITTSRTRFGLGRIYLSATSEARRRGDRRVGTEHLLLAVLVDADSVPARAFGVSSTTARDALQTMDDIALASLGITAGELGRAVIPGHERDRLRLTPAARAVFTGLRRRAGEDRIAVGHVLLTLLDGVRPDPAAELIDALGVDRDGVRERLRH